VTTPTEPPRTALLAGATGLVGKLCLEELLAASLYDRVLAVSRRPLDREHPKLHVAVTDFDRLDHLDAGIRATDAFCCLGTTIAKAGSQERFRKVDYEYTLRFARLARLRGAERFVLISSIGAASGARSFYLKVKGETEAAVSTIGYPTLVILRPSLLLGSRPERRPLEQLAQAALRRLSWAMVGPLRRFRPIEAAVVARAMVRLAASPLRGSRLVESDAIVEAGR